MIQEESMIRHDTGKLYDFWHYRSKKPYFTKPLSIKIGDPLRDTYQIVGNIVYQDKQIVGLKRESDPVTILLVEARIENGTFTSIHRIPHPLLNEIKGLFIEDLSVGLL